MIASQFVTAPNTTESLAAVQKSRQQLQSRQASMRSYINECNAKCKNGTTVLTRKANREWAGDMPKVQVPARTIHGSERMKERNISDKQATDAIINPIDKEPIKTDNLGRREQTYIGRSATVILNPDTGEIVTAYPTSTRRRRKYEDDR